ncbi:hypothetical protein WA158_007247 [Blastocystis sp. Blastoise]
MNKKAAIGLFLGGCFSSWILKRIYNRLFVENEPVHIYGHSFYIGITVCATKVRAGVVRDDFVIISRKTIPICSRNSEAVITIILTLIDEVITMSGLSRSSIESIGIGIPGYISHRTGIILQASHFPEWKNIPITDIIYEHTHIKTYADNDSNVLTLYEYVHGNKDIHKDIFVLNVSSGVGGGYICDNHLMRGFRGGVAEIGHNIYRPNGYKCLCGQRGCVETYASILALVARAKRELEKLKTVRSAYNNQIDTSSELKRNYSQKSILTSSLENVSPLTADSVVTAAEAGDPIGLKCFIASCVSISICCINIYKSFDPEIIILNGSLANAGILLYDYINIYIDLFHGNMNVYEDIPIKEYDSTYYQNIVNKINDYNITRDPENYTERIKIKETDNTIIVGKTWVIPGSGGDEAGIIGGAALAMNIL